MVSVPRALSLADMEALVAHLSPQIPARIRQQLTATLVAQGGSAEQQPMMRSTA